ncbi:MAG TPA: histidine kinase [Candidatus Dormibacteraeota bacterium]|nr:histidine kinase [Candidatus Dormibacteraeota bacterium]
MAAAIKPPVRQATCLLLLIIGFQAYPQETNRPLTRAADVLLLSAERAAAGLTVTVTGIVTAADQALKGRFFVQDESGGVFVDNIGGQKPDPGDLVEVSGITHAGAFAPIITAPQVRKIGIAPLPPAKPVPLERLMSGAEDSQRVEVVGEARAAHVEGSRLTVDLASGGYRLRVYAPATAVRDPQRLVAAQVRVRGTAAEAHNRSMRQLIAVEIYVPRNEDFVIDRYESSDPFAQPVIPLSSLAQYRKENSLNDRTHVKGVVTLQRADKTLFLQDDTGGLEIKNSQPGIFQPGDVIEAIGFPSFEGFLPVLEDAVFRRDSATPASVVPRPATVEELQNGLHHAAFVSMRGRLIDRAIRHVRTAQHNPPTVRTTLALQTENVLFTAETEGPPAPELASIPIGSTVRVSGVCLKDIDSEGKMTGFRILFGTPADLTIIQRPSWFTPQRLLAGLAIVTIILVLITTWTITVSRKNSVLKFLVREREQAQLELQKAHDLLEQRVKERTQELKFQITARKESEVQFKAVLSERTRLAQELHDTLEQSLTGIGLQLDTASRLFQRNPNGASHHLELARNLMGQSKVEVRRSIWDLRSRALEQFDLAGAMKDSARQLMEASNVQIEVVAVGRVRPLSERIEDNLLRMMQEALTNVIKHSGAGRAMVELDFGPRTVGLVIEDNGKGFDPTEAGRPQEGHFGLVGISERAKRLGGTFSITSSPSAGTCLRILIPLESQPDPTTAKPLPEQEAVAVLDTHTNGNNGPPPAVTASP